MQETGIINISPENIYWERQKVGGEGDDRG